MTLHIIILLQINVIMQIHILKLSVYQSNNCESCCDARDELRLHKEISHLNKK